MTCKRCQARTPEVFDRGILYLLAPIEHTVNKLERILTSHNTAYARDEKLLAVQINNQLPTLTDVLTKYLSHTELDNTRTLFMHEGDTLSTDKIIDAQSLTTLLAKLASGWLINMIQQNRLLVHMQPIVHAQDTDQVYAHECLLRGIDEAGELVYPKHMFDIAYSAQLTYQLDRAARLAAIHTAKEKLVDGNIFINFNPTSVYDPHTCLKSTFAAIQNSDLSPSQIVFEVTESEYIDDTNHLIGIISKYRAEGFRIALDDLGSGYSSLGLLAELKPDLVKFDRKLITNIDSDSFKQRVLVRLFEMTGDLGITTVAEGVERPEERDWLAAHGADYLQGFLFGRPAADPKYLGGLTPPNHSVVYA